MIVYCVDVYVAAGHEAEFLAATRENHQATRREPGNLRFDVLQSREDPSRFFLYEVYASDAAAAAHKQTPHYQAWRDRVAPWMARPREGRRYQPHFPAAREAW